VAGRRGERRLLFASYGLCVLLAILLLTGDEVVAGFNVHFFGPYPKAGPLHPVHVLQTIFLAWRSGWLLVTARREVRGKARRRLLDLCLLSLCLHVLSAGRYLHRDGAGYSWHHDRAPRPDAPIPACRHCGA
jgi:hypothetical protein